MYPFLFDWKIGQFHLRPPMFGVLLALAFSISYFEALRRSIKLKEDPKHVENQFLLVVFGSILGSRLFHVIFEEWDYYSQHWLKIFAIWEGGYTLYGAFLTSMLLVYLYCKIKRLEVLQYFDIGMVVSALGIFIGRIGCLVAGCCWGKPTSMPWGIVFSNPLAFTDVHDKALHPTQLYEAFAALGIFIYLQIKFRNRTYPGQIAFPGLILYCLSRFVIEYFRGDEYRGFIFGGFLSYGQFISLLILPFAVTALILYSKQDEG